MSKLILKNNKKSTQVNYQESTKATIIWTVGFMFTCVPLSLLGIAMYSNSIIVGDEARSVLIGLAANGAAMAWYAPIRAKKDMEKRIVKDLKYAKYIVRTYPQHIERVMELRPEGKDEIRQWALEALPKNEISKVKVRALLIVCPVALLTGGILMLIFMYIWA